MRYIFIRNPGAGGSKKYDVFFQKLRAAAKKLKVAYEIYETKSPGDGMVYTAQVCRETAGTGETLRIYGCGGDGTLHELVNGAYGFDHVEIGMIPLGTGNDYIRNYGTTADFLDPMRQLAGKSQHSDLIHYRAEYESDITEGYCANMFNIGFDCNVVDLTDRVKRLPLIGGSLAYLISVCVILVKKKGADLRIEFPDGSVKDGPVLLAAIANGCYCGGGVKGVPQCVLDDGLMDVSIINDISRTLFLRLFPSYAAGTHLEKKHLAERGIIRYSKEPSLTVTANGESLRLCTDGEITTQKRIEFDMVRNAFRFIVPADANGDKISFGEENVGR